MLPCVPGEFVLYGPTGVLAVWAKVDAASPLPDGWAECSEWALEFSEHLCLQKVLQSRAIPHVAGAFTPTKAFYGSGQDLL